MARRSPCHGSGSLLARPRRDATAHLASAGRWNMLQAGKTAMKKTAQLKAIAVVLSGVVIPVAATGGGTEGIVRVPRPPVISPDYTGVVIPPNMAPLNFTVR